MESYFGSPSPVEAKRIPYLKTHPGFLLFFFFFRIPAFSCSHGFSPDPGAWSSGFWVTGPRSHKYPVFEGTDFVQNSLDGPCGF